MCKKDRLRSFRKAIGLNQKQFAAKLGLSQAGYSLYEVGKSEISDRLVMQISQTFHINEEWLKTGEGDMMQASKISSEIEQFMRTFEKLPEDKQKMLHAIAKTLLQDEL